MLVLVLKLPEFVLYLHGDAVCVKVKWMYPAGGLGPEPKNMSTLKP